MEEGMKAACDLVEEFSHHSVKANVANLAVVFVAMAVLVAAMVKIEKKWG